MILENHLGRFVIDEGEALECATILGDLLERPTHIAFWYPTEALAAKLKPSRPTFEDHIIFQYDGDVDPIEAAQTLLENS